MVDSVSCGSADIAALSIAQSQQNVQLTAGVSMLKKTMDTQSAALLQLIQSMGVANNVDALA